MPASWNFDLDRLYNGHAHASAAPLIAPFTAKEADQAIVAMNKDSAPGPDGVGPGFYATVWPLIEETVTEFLHAFHSEEIDLQRVNRALIVLIPKNPAALSPLPSGLSPSKTAL